MTRYSIYLEIHNDGRCMAHVFDLPGCIVRASSRDEALRQLPDAIRTYHTWLQAHGEPAPPAEEPFDIEIAGESTGFGPFDRGDAAALFPPDQAPITPEEMELHFRFLAHTRADLLALVRDPSTGSLACSGSLLPAQAVSGQAGQGLPDDILDWQTDPHSFSLRGLLRHVGNAEEWYVSRLVHPETPWPERRSQGGLPTAWKNDEGLPIFDFLEMERRTALARLRQLTEKERSEVFFPTHWTDHSDEPWTARKVLRRFLEHEQEHTAQAREILAAWRHHLLAHLASERAGLLRQIIGLDEGTLTGTSVFDDWTAKDLLAHIAAWDEIHAERLELVLTGREEEITVGEVGARNAALYAERRDWPLEQVLAACVNARAACLAVAARLSDQDLHRTRRFPWGEGSAATLAQRRARHDAIHAADLAAWRQAQKIQSRPGPKAILLAALAAGREELLAAADLMPPEARGSRAIVGEWTLKDVLGHVADWDWWGVKALRQVVTGRASQIKYVEDLEAWNQAHVAARRGQSWETVWADVHTARRALLDVLASMSQADLEQPFPSRWNGESTPYRWAEIYLEHDHEHARSLRIA